MKSALFLNGSYFDNVLASFGDAKIDYETFVANAMEQFTSEHIRTYYYHCPPYKSNNPTEEEENRHNSKMGFFTALSHIPNFTVFLGQLAFRGYNDTGKPIFVRRLIDVQMCFDMLRLASQSDIGKFILISGDNNLVQPIGFLKDTSGINIQLLHGPQNERYFVHRDLLNICDGVSEITKDMIDNAPND